MTLRLPACMTDVSSRVRWRLSQQNKAIEECLSPRPDAPLKVLDLGIEYGHSGVAVKGVWRNAHVEGADLWMPYVKHAANLVSESGGFVYETVVNADALQVIRSAFERGLVWDVVLAAEIIEHNPPAWGLELLSLLPKVSRLAVVTAPLGNMAQGSIDGNPHQAHVSEWEEADFEGAGFFLYANLPRGQGAEPGNCSVWCMV